MNVRSVPIHRPTQCNPLYILAAKTLSLAIYRSRLRYLELMHAVNDVINNYI